MATGGLAVAGRLARWCDARRRRRGQPQVVFIGDSITLFWRDCDPCVFLTGDYVNAGISGEATAGIRARFARDVVALRPALVHIMAGTNDLWHGDPGIDAGDAIANVAAMAAMAEAAGIAIIVAAPPPISPAAAAGFAHSELEPMLRAGLADLCRRKALVHVDYARSLAGADGAWVAEYTTDGVHLTRRGYLAMREQARAALRGVLG